MKARVSRLLLTVAGAVLAGVGISVLFYPASFAAANGVLLANDASTLSEYRAPGGMLLASGAFVLFAAVRRRYSKAGLALSAAVFASYGIARLVGILADGAPSAALLQATAAECGLGLTCFVTWLLVHRREPEIGQR